MYSSNLHQILIKQGRWKKRLFLFHQDDKMMSTWWTKTMLIIRGLLMFSSIHQIHHYFRFGAILIKPFVAMFSAKKIFADERKIIIKIITIMNSEQAKQMLIEIICWVSEFSVKQSGHNLWYKSPFRNEKNPSFSEPPVSTNGVQERREGNIIDLVMKQPMQTALRALRTSNKPFPFRNFTLFFSSAGFRME